MGLPVQPAPRTITLPVNIRFSGSHEIDLQLNPHTTLEKFQDGVAEESDWHLLALRVKWGKVLSEAHWQQATDSMITAQESLLSVQARHDKMGKWSLSQPEYVAIGEALNMSDTLQLHCTRRQLRDALEAVYLSNAAISRHKPWRALEAA